MKLIASVSILLTIVFWSSLGHTAEVAIPDEKNISGLELPAFSGRWKQLVLAEDQWVERAEISETLRHETLDGEKVYRHTQTVKIPDGRQVEMVSYFKAPTMVPLRASRQFTGFPKGAPSQQEFYFDAKTATLKTILGDETTETVLHTTAPMYNGLLLGLLIAALPLEEDLQLRVPAVMPAMQYTYWMTLDVQGTETVTVQGAPKSVWRVDAEWLNLHDGSIYDGGPGGSGGSYYIFRDPPPGMPPVYRYVNTNVDIVYAPEGD